jgi:hypothetical protein
VSSPASMACWAVASEPGRLHFHPRLVNARMATAPIMRLNSMRITILELTEKKKGSMETFLNIVHS